MTKQETSALTSCIIEIMLSFFSVVSFPKGGFLGILVGCFIIAILSLFNIWLTKICKTRRGSILESLLKGDFWEAYLKTFRKRNLLWALIEDNWVFGVILLLSFYFPQYGNYFSFFLGIALLISIVSVYQFFRLLRR